MDEERERAGQFEVDPAHQHDSSFGLAFSVPEHARYLLELALDPG